MRKSILFFLISVLLSPYAFSESSNPNLYLHGIWKNKAFENAYYSIHTNSDTNQIIFIDLLSVNSLGSAEQSTYIGNINDSELNSLIPRNYGVTGISINFTSATGGAFFVICDVCSSTLQEIEKVF